MKLLKKYLTPLLILAIGILLYLHFVRSNEVITENPNKELLNRYKASQVRIKILNDALKVNNEKQKELDSSLSNKKKEVERLKSRQYENVNVISEYTPDELYKLCSSITRRSYR